MKTSDPEHRPTYTMTWEMLIERHLSRALHYEVFDSLIEVRYTASYPDVTVHFLTGTLTPRDEASIREIYEEFAATERDVRQITYTLDTSSQRDSWGWRRAPAVFVRRPDDPGFEVWLSLEEFGVLVQSIDLAGSTWNLGRKSPQATNNDRIKQFRQWQASFKEAVSAADKETPDYERPLTIVRLGSQMGIVGTGRDLEYMMECLALTKDTVSPDAPHTAQVESVLALLRIAFDEHKRLSA